MAEAFGVAASAVGIASLGIQIVNSVRQLLDLWTYIKEAPEFVRKLLEDLKLQ